MKKRTFLKFCFQAVTLSTSPVPGVFLLAGGPAGKQAPLVILSQVPNQEVEDKCGWNFCCRDTDDANKMKLSKKLNPLYDATAVNPLVPQFIPANFKTALEAASAFESQYSTYAKDF